MRPYILQTTLARQPSVLPITFDSRFVRLSTQLGSLSTGPRARLAVDVFGGGR